MQSALSFIQRAAERLVARAKLARYALAAALLSAPVLALAQVEMPTIPQPTGVADGDIIGYVRWGLGMVFMLLGGSTAVYSLFTAGSRTVAKFHEYSNNRAEFGDVVTIAVAGIVVCTLCILLVVAGLRVIPVTA
jgi:hypothetical protein